MEIPSQPRHNFKWLIVLAAIFFIISAGLAGTYWSFLKRHQGRIFTGVSIGQIDLSRLTRAQAAERVQAAIDNIRQNGLIFAYHKQNTALYPVIASMESDLAFEVISFDPEDSLDRAYRWGREGGFWTRLGSQCQAIFRNIGLPLDHEISPRIDDFLADNFSHFETPATDAQLIAEKTSAGYEFQIKAEQYGQRLDFEQAKSELADRLSRLDSQPITITAVIDHPRLYKAECLNIESEAARLLSLAPLRLAYQAKSWEIGQDSLAGYLTLVKNGDSSADKVSVGLKKNLVGVFLEEKVSPVINKEPIDPKFAVENGKVVEFQLSREGELVNIEKTLEALEAALDSGTTTPIAIATDIVQSNLSAADVDDMGVKELLGTGHSSFAGSPKNRRHNIATGAASVNGTLVAPGEEFSLLKVLGDIDKAAGYLPELVIKENKTIPEYGGGLCQIGTTAFRGTLAAGLPVTARRNHSYRVSYYEPAGTDATIYDPWPDYKFLNDYQTHILITSRIDGDDLYFDFWGTHDGRSATATYPVIYNIARPAPTKFIETLDLKPGEKKCTEHAHNGADAYFDYTVAYGDHLPADFADREGADSETRTETTRFKSHYVPWREVCLIGVEKLGGTDPSSDPASADSQASSTSPKPSPSQP